MIRGPSRGLGTFRCRCRWILLLLTFILPLLVITASAQPTQASAAHFSSTSPPSSFFQQQQIPSNMLGPSGSVSQHHHSRVHHHHHHHHHQQQQAARGGYKATGPSKESGSGSSTEEGSILRLLSKNNLYVQSFPNGTVSATGQDSSFYSVLQQKAVDFGRIYIQGVASRLFICINECGRLYGSEHLEPDCILRDQMEGNWYNTYTSINHSTAEKSLYMAFNSNTGSPCRLRLKSETTSDGRSMVALGSNEKYALFFPVRNISLPDGMNLTSLIQLNKRIPFVKNSVKPTGCAPRCSKSSDQSIKAETSSNRASSKEKSKRKNKCSCLPTETPAQGGGNVERCRRPRQCRPTLSSRTEHGSNGESSSSSSSSNVAVASGWNQLQRPQRIREKENRKPKRVSTSTENSVTDVNLLLSVDGRLGSPSDNADSVQWMVERSKSTGGKAKNKKTTTTTTTAATTQRERSPERDRIKKGKNRRGKNQGAGKEESRSSSKHQPKSNKSAIREDGAIRLASHRKSDSRLIRHRYRKIRAHPELAQQLAAMS